MVPIVHEELHLGDPWGEVGFQNLKWGGCAVRRGWLGSWGRKAWLLGSPWLGNRAAIGPLNGRQASNSLFFGHVKNLVFLTCAMIHGLGASLSICIVM